MREYAPKLLSIFITRCTSAAPLPFSGSISAPATILPLNLTRKRASRSIARPLINGPFSPPWTTSPSASLPSSSLMTGSRVRPTAELIAMIDGAMGRAKAGEPPQREVQGRPWESVMPRAMRGERWRTRAAKGERKGEVGLLGGLTWRARCTLISPSWKGRAW